jgi:EAL domain-containing protein (putative c-di-GMP-specific phosphodiesterase class I)
MLEEIKKFGFKLGLDDFGTGYSSLSYLQRLPIDKIKIDQQFTTNMAISKQAMAIVSATLALAQTLDLEIVAEGVETADQMQLLLKHGCVRQQGFLFSRAIPAADLQRWVASFEKH